MPTGGLCNPCCMEECTACLPSSFSSPKQLLFFSVTPREVLQPISAYTMLLSEMAAAAAAALLFATRAQADDKVTCYKPDGTPDPEMKPCDPTAKVSTCCRPDDFCLSNGLCLGGGGNNGFSQQGCTKEKWDFPCQQLCTDQMGMPMRKKSPSSSSRGCNQTVANVRIFFFPSSLQRRLSLPAAVQWLRLYRI